MTYPTIAAGHCGRRCQGQRMSFAGQILNRVVPKTLDVEVGGASVTGLHDEQATWVISRILNDRSWYWYWEPGEPDDRRRPSSARPRGPEATPAVNPHRPHRRFVPCDRHPDTETTAGSPSRPPQTMTTSHPNWTLKFIHPLARRPNRTSWPACSVCRPPNAPRSNRATPRLHARWLPDARPRDGQPPTRPTTPAVRRTPP